MAKRIHPSSSSRDPARDQVPGRRGRVRRGRMSSRAATTEAGDGRRGVARRPPAPRRWCRTRPASRSWISSTPQARRSTPCSIPALFWPELLEVDGAVLLASSVEDEADLARVRASLRERGPRRDRAALQSAGALGPVRQWSCRDRRRSGGASCWRGSRRCGAAVCRTPSRSAGSRSRCCPPNETGGDIGICFHQS